MSLPHGRELAAWSTLGAVAIMLMSMIVGQFNEVDGRLRALEVAEAHWRAERLYASPTRKHH